jgi:hypothetical protein
MQALGQDLRTDAVVIFHPELDLRLDIQHARRYCLHDGASEQTENLARTAAVLQRAVVLAVTPVVQGVV